MTPAVLPKSGSLDRSRLSPIGLGTVALVAAATIVLWILNVGTQNAVTDFGTRASSLVLVVDGLIFAVVGALIVSRRQGNAVGQVCFLVGLMIEVNTLSIEYAVHALLTDPGTLLGGTVAAWLANWTWVLYIGLMATVLVLVFPDGRLPSRRWRPVLVIAVAAMTMAAVSFALAPGQFLSVPWASNPFGVDGLVTVFEFLSLGFFLLALTIVAAAWSMVLRFRRARGEQRQQIKWFASAASILAIVYVGQAFYALFTGTLGDSTDEQRVLQTVIVATFGVVGLSVGVAVMRYRLYQIDHVISRTVSYGLMTGILGTVYALSVFGLGRIFPSENDLTVAASTLAVAALFAPLRRRVQAMVDRRFNRIHYDAARTLERFSEKLRHATDMGSLEGDLSSVAGSIMEPAHVSLWLKDRS